MAHKLDSTQAAVVLRTPVPYRLRSTWSIGWVHLELEVESDQGSGCLGTIYVRDVVLGACIRVGRECYRLFTAQSQLCRVLPCHFSLPFGYQVAHRELDANTNACICVKQLQNFVVFPFDVLLQLFPSHRKVVKQCFHHNNCPLLSRYD